MSFDHEKLSNNKDINNEKKSKSMTLSNSFKHTHINNSNADIINFNNLNVTIRDKTIIKNISLTIPNKNDIIVIAGASGSGKSTILNIINNYSLPSYYKLTGNLKYFNSKIKMIGHKPVFNPFFTTKEMIQMYIDRYNYDKTVDYYLEMFHLEDIKDKYIGDDTYKSLSTGQLVQLSILLNTMEIPDMLILDEPLSNLDIKTSIHIMKVLKELEIPIILTLHHPNNIILKYINRLILMDEGEIILDKDLDGIINKLEFYEDNIIKEKDNAIQIVTTDSKIKGEIYNNSLKVSDFKHYTYKVSFVNKIYYSAKQIYIYTFFNKNNLIGIFSSNFLVIIAYILLNGTDFSDKINGYFHFINLCSLFFGVLPPSFFIFIFQYEKILPLKNELLRFNIIEYRSFTVVYFMFQQIFVFFNAILFGLVLSYLSPENNILFSYLTTYFSLYSIFSPLVSYSILHIFENISINQSLYAMVTFFIILTSGLNSNNKNYLFLNKASLQYYLFNLLSVKTQELFNYTLLPNGKYQYTTYGYTEDLTNFNLYITLFYILPILIMLFYTKNNKRIFIN